MVGNYTFSSFANFTQYIQTEVKLGYDILLFRGQTTQGNLLPGMARQRLSVPLKVAEREMMTELKRRTRNMPNTHTFDDWDWLIYAQHFGMKTRLLDWTINPLVALWFACYDEWSKDNTSFLYVLQADKQMLVNTATNENPFDIIRLKILKPALNNDRIVAQAGWFTVHPINPQTGLFEEMSQSGTSNQVFEVTIPAHTKAEILRQLDLYGINQYSMFPGIEGICKYMNYAYASPFNYSERPEHLNKAITAV